MRLTKADVTEKKVKYLADLGFMHLKFFSNCAK